MTVLRNLFLVVGGVSAMFLVAVATQHLMADRAPNSLLVIDPKLVVKRFVEERGNEMSDATFKDAILQLDAIVLAEAAAIHNARGAMLVNKDHVLAGGLDVSEAFSDRVIARWDDWVARQARAQ